MQKTRVFADTNVILESFRTGCWNAISTHFAIETVEKCVEETLTGNQNDSHHIKVLNVDLKKGLTAKHTVQDRDVASLVLSYPSCSALDDGELHLFAWILANKLLPSPVNLVTTADKAALVATHRLGWLNSAVSLEHLANKAGVDRAKLNDLRLHYGEKWLSDQKIAVRLGVLT